MYGSPPSAPKDLNRPFPPVSTHQQQNHHQMSSGLLRYRSAPSSLLGEVCDDFLPVRPSSPETDTMFARLLSSDLRDEIRSKPQQSGGGGCGGQRNHQLPPPSPQPPQPPPSSAAEENMGGSFSSAASTSQMMYQHHHNQIQNLVASSMAMETEQIKNGGGGGSGSNLLRQSSSPAGLFSHLNVENVGYGVMRGIGGFRNGNDVGSVRLKSQLSFSSMSQISEIENEYNPMGSWDDSAMLSDNNFSPLKRPRDHNQADQKGVEMRNGLSHQFSLPKTSSEMAAIEKFLQFQDTVPCKIRAKRGCATHPRSIAERVRRTRISERMRKLQELVPNMDKQTNTADMLDLAVDYIKDLQKHVKMLSDSRAGCSCSSSKQKPYTNSSV